MIGRADLEERVREWGLREDIVEKDYVIGWVLWGIGSDDGLAATWAFKGGTAIKKCYLETYRFSEDLDFTVLPGGPIAPDEFMPILEEILGRVAEESGINFSGRPPYAKPHPSGQYAEVRVYYQGPRGSPMVTAIRLDLLAREKVVRPTVLRQVQHSYPDELPSPATVRCYSLAEIFAEKIRAMGERGRPRDLYDIVNLFRRDELRDGREEIHAILVEKCEGKGVPVPTFETINAGTIRQELEADWSNMLAHQLLALPPLESFWEELPRLFEWLAGRLVVESPATVPLGADDVPEWAPPPTVSTWGAPVPLEAIRFAATNHLCVELGYGGTTRIIEPYSLRQSRAGNLLLYSTRVDNRELRAYRVDRIESVRVTNQPFVPAFRVEFSSAGPIQAAPLATTPPRGGRISRRTHSGPVYVVECFSCRKQFRRKRRNTSLRPHKTPDGWPCSGRRGYLVDTEYG